MTNRTSPSLFLVLIITWFGSGLSPRAPGTVGTLAALPFAIAMIWAAGPAYAHWVLSLAALLVFLIGWWASDAYVRLTGTKDPGLIVIDEVAGIWLTLAVAPLDPVAIGLGFVLFRLFDILKPWPVSWADKAVKGGLGIMLDDILAGLFAGAGLWLVLRYVY